MGTMASVIIGALIPAALALIFKLSCRSGRYRPRPSTRCYVVLSWIVGIIAAWPFDLLFSGVEIYSPIAPFTLGAILGGWLTAFVVVFFLEAFNL